MEQWVTRQVKKKYKKIDLIISPLQQLKTTDLVIPKDEEQFTYITYYQTNSIY